MIMEDEARINFNKTLEYLKTKKRVLFLTTSNRWSGEMHAKLPKSTALAYKMKELLNDKANTEAGECAVTLIEVPLLNIHPCEGNVSTKQGNTCGLVKAALTDHEKNPSGLHRCWASINNPDDELWKISKELFESDCVLFFGSIRWGQLNSYYQKLIERLTWIENRHSTLGEENVIENIDAGIITIGHNWHGHEAMETQKKVLGYFGFRIVDDLCWHWQFTDNALEESEGAYLDAAVEFEEKFLK